MTPREFVDDFDGELLTADGLDDAIIGIASGWFPTEEGGVSQSSVVAYDYDKCIEIVSSRDDIDLDEAEEFLSFNTLGAYVGPLTPIFIQRPPKD